MSAAGTSTADAPASARRWRWTDAALLLIALTASTVVHRGILRNYFFTDDFLNLYRIKNAGLWEYLFTPHGGHLLLVRNAIFYVTASLFDTSPPGYFLSVLLTHLLNVALLYAVIRNVSGSPHLACFGSTLWGTSPIHSGALGWYSVYGHVVAGTLLLAILCIVTRAGAAERAPGRAALALCYALALLAVFSFGVGIGLAMTLPLAVAWLAPAARRTARWGMPLWSLFLAVPLLYVGFFFLHGRLFGEGLETPNTLTTLVVLHLTSIPARLAQMIGYAIMQLGLGFAFAPQMFGGAIAYTLVALLVAVTLLAARRAAPPRRRALAAMAVLTVGCYAIIVMGRIVFFDAYSDIVMAIQPRYHYAGLIPLTVIACLLLAEVGAWLQLSARSGAALLALWLVGLAATYGTSRFAVDHHDLSKERTEQVLRIIDSSVDGQPLGADVYIDNRGFAGFPGGAPRAVFPGWAAVFVIYHANDTVGGRRVRFVDGQLEVLVAAARGRRSAGLIVPRR